MWAIQRYLHSVKQRNKITLRIRRIVQLIPPLGDLIRAIDRAEKCSFKPPTCAQMEESYLAHWLPRHSSHLHTLLKTRKMLTTFKLTSKCCHQPDWLTNRLTDWMTGWLTMAKEGCRGGWDSDADGAFPVEQHAVAFTVAADRCVGGNRRYMGLVLGVINIFDS